jgi:hypothetical protein
MDFGQVTQKTSVACFNSSQPIADYLVDIAEMAPKNRQLVPGRQNVKCVSL